MVSTQNKQMAQFFASITERMSGTDLDLATIRDVYENLHLAAREPEGVYYAEVDINGVPALWCVPTDCDMNRVLLHAHGGGTVLFSMHLDRKAVGHPPRLLVRVHSCWITGARQNTSSQLKSRTWKRHTTGSLRKGFVLKTSPLQASRSVAISL